MNSTSSSSSIATTNHGKRRIITSSEHELALEKMKELTDATGRLRFTSYSSTITNGKEGAGEINDNKKHEKKIELQTLESADARLLHERQGRVGESNLEVMLSFNHLGDNASNSAAFALDKKFSTFILPATTTRRRRSDSEKKKMRPSSSSILPVEYIEWEKSICLNNEPNAVLMNSYISIAPSSSSSSNNNNKEEEEKEEEVVFDDLEWKEEEEEEAGNATPVEQGKQKSDKPPKRGDWELPQDVSQVRRVFDVSSFLQSCFTANQDLTLSDWRMLPSRGARVAAHALDLNFWTAQHKSKLETELELKHVERDKAATSQGAPPVSDAKDEKKKPVPSKKEEILKERMDKYGDLLREMGITSVGAVPSTTTTVASVVTKKKTAAWKTKLPKVAHRGEAANLEVFHPVLRESRGDEPRLREAICLEPVREADAERVLQGEVCILEYAELHPIVSPARGMGANVVNLFREKEPAWDCGLNVELKRDEPSPVLHPLTGGESLQVYQSDLMMAPLYRHQVKHCYLMRRHGKTFQLLPIRRTFLVGQVEPHVEVFEPIDGGALVKSSFSGWMEKYMSFRILKHLVDSAELEINAQYAVSLFENMREQLVLQVLEKDLALTRDQNVYRFPFAARRDRKDRRMDKHEAKKYLMDKMKQLLSTEVSPEDCVAYEALQRGYQRLKQAGILKVVNTRVHRLMEAYQFVTKMMSHRLAYLQAARTLSPSPNAPIELDPQTKTLVKAVRFVLREVQTSPWYLSSCFYYLFLHPEERFQGKKDRGNCFSTSAELSMRVFGHGDPSLAGEMVSFLPKHRAEEEDVDYHREKKRRTSGIVKRQLGGTEDDLRRLSMQELGDILVALGVDEETVKTISRWPRTWLIATVASSKEGEFLLGGSLKKFNRNDQPMSTIPNNAENLHFSSQARALQRVVASQDEVLVRKYIEGLPAFKTTRAACAKVCERARQTLSQGVGPAPIEYEDVEEDPDLLVSEMGEELDDLLKSTDSTSRLGHAKSEKREMERVKQERANRASLQGASWLADEDVRRRYEAYQPRKVVKKTIIEVMPNGQERVRVEFHKKDVARFMAEQEVERKRRAIKRQNGNAGNKLYYHQRERAVTNEEHARGLSEKQQAFRKWYLDQVEMKGKDFYLDVTEDTLPSMAPRSRSGLQVKCTKCFLPGHNSNSAVCPMLTQHGALVAAPTLPPAPSAVLAMLEEEEEGSALLVAGGAIPHSIKTFKGFEGPDLAEPRKLFGNHKLLSEHFLSLVAAAAQQPFAAAFRKRVDTRMEFCMEYYRVIANPKDLERIAALCNAGEYPNRDAFLRDFKQVVENSKIFNNPAGRVYITKSAAQLFVYVRRAIRVSGFDYDKCELLPNKGDFAKDYATLEREMEDQGLLPRVAEVVVEEEEEEVLIVGKNGDGGTQDVVIEEEEEEIIL